MSGLFVTGTDTGCGKTEAALGLMAALQARGYAVTGMKPVASGCLESPDGLRNADAERLRAQSSRRLAYRRINPFAFADPIAPHIAAERAGVSITAEAIRSAYRDLEARADVVIVEGVGGWAVPLGKALAVSDLPAYLGIPVVMVVGLRLGCLNHALLTSAAIASSGLSLVGWIGSRIDPVMAVADENIASLAERIEAPCLGVLPWLNNPSATASARYLEIDPRALEWLGVREGPGTTRAHKG